MATCALIMMHFLLQLSKGYCVIKAGQAKIWTLGIWPGFSQKKKEEGFDSVTKAHSHLL